MTAKHVHSLPLAVKILNLGNFQNQHTVQNETILIILVTTVVFRSLYIFFL